MSTKYYTLGMIKRAIVRHSNFITPYNRPYEYNATFKAINLAGYERLIEFLGWRNGNDLRNMDIDQMINAIPDNDKTTVSVIELNTI